MLICYLRVYLKNMKKILFTLTLLMGANGAFAQNSELEDMTKEELKETCQSFIKLTTDLITELQDIDSCHYTHEKYLFCEAINNDTTWTVKSPWDFLDIKVLSAIGDRKTQSVTIELLLSNSTLNQKIYVDAFGSEAVDAIGKASPLQTINVGSGRHFGTVYTDVPIRVKLIFSGVMPGTEKFNLASFKMSSIDESSRNTPVKQQVEIRNIPLVW